MEEAIDKLHLFNKKQLRMILLFILRDLINWKNHPNLIESKRMHTEVILHTLLHKINTETINEEE